MEHFNFTDRMIDEFFKNNKLENSNFFAKLEDSIKTSQILLGHEYDKLVKENEYHATQMNETKNDYFEKLDIITNLYSNFEYRVSHVNKIYSDKLSYISVLSGNLEEFENFDKNIVYANKIFEYFDLMNKNDDINKVMPEIFTNPTLMLDEGVEVFEAFRQLVSANTGEYPVFQKNYSIIEQKIKQCVQDSIKYFCEENKLDKLEKLMKITEKLHTEFIIDTYVKYVIDTMNLGSIIKTMENISYLKMSEEMYTHIFKIVEEFHNNIVKYCYDQYGKREGMMYLLFPTTKQKYVISNLINQVSQHLNKFRQIVENEKDKSPEVYVKIIDHFYPQNKKFIQEFKQFSEAMKIDWNDIEESTRTFIIRIESIYRSKEEKLYSQFIKANYESKLEKAKEIPSKYNSKSLSLDGFTQECFNLIESTNFSVIHQFSVDTITRIFKLISHDFLRTDTIETYLDRIIDSIKNLLMTYCGMTKILFVDSEKSNQVAGTPHYTLFSRINFLYLDIQNMFLFELKDFFKSVKLNEEVEYKLKSRLGEVNTSVDKLFNQLSSYIYGSLNLILKTIKYKEIYYNIKSANEYANSPEFENLCYNFLKPVFNAIHDNMIDTHRIKLSQSITKIIADKLVDILRNAKISKEGTKVMKSDFKMLFNIFVERLDEKFFMQIHDCTFLVEIFFTSKDALDSFVDTINVEDENRKRKYDPELLKIILKKRKDLKI